jgi:uncharacterized membrane protein
MEVHLMPAYTMREAEQAEQRAADALAYNRQAARHSKALQKQATELRRRTGEARDRLTDRRQQHRG